MNLFSSTHRFEFDRQPSITPMDVELMLRRYGIPITGRDMGELHKHGDGGKGEAGRLAKDAHGEAQILKEGLNEVPT